MSSDDKEFDIDPLLEAESNNVVDELSSYAKRMKYGEIDGEVRVELSLGDLEVRKRTKIEHLVRRVFADIAEPQLAHVAMRRSEADNGTVIMAARLRNPEETDAEAKAVLNEFSAKLEGIGIEKSQIKTPVIIPTTESFIRGGNTFPYKR